MHKIVSFEALQAGGQVEVSPGDTLEVVVSFNYKAEAPVTVEAWLSLVIPPGRDQTYKQQVELSVAPTIRAWSGSLTVPITASGLDNNYVYDLWFELPYETSEKAIAYGAILVTGIVGITDTITQMIGLMMVMMMMTMMMQMMED